jgi:sugar O-acyltransferase (sialic acid O-acetyltransferase NeuD family)
VNNPDPVENSIFIFGASGHAKVVADCVERENRWRIAALVDDDPALWGEEVAGYTVRGGTGEVPGLIAAGAGRCIVAIGSNTARAAVAARLTGMGAVLVTSVHPAATVARSATLGGGTVLMAGAVVNSDSRVGENVIVNTGATVDHDCLIGDGVHIAPGAHICGGVTVGEGSLIGVGASVIPLRRVGRFATVGAGSAVISDVADGDTVAGVPAVSIKTKRTGHS